MSDRMFDEAERLWPKFVTEAEEGSLTPEYAFKLGFLGGVMLVAEELEAVALMRGNTETAKAIREVYLEY